MAKYRYFAVTILACGVVFFSNGQMQIKTDTIANDCLTVYKMKSEIFIIKSQNDYENSEFFTSSGGCLPFHGIDFDIYILVGYKFQGSNCDTSIQWSRIVRDGNGYLIQFSTPTHVCRDLQYRLALFIIDKPPKEIDLSVERTSKRLD